MILRRRSALLWIAASLVLGLADLDFTGKAQAQNKERPRQKAPPGLPDDTEAVMLINFKQLLAAPEFAQRLGVNGHEHVRNNFLLTRHMRDYMLAFLFLGHLNETVIRL